MEAKETKEAIIATVVLGKFVIDRLKDGVDLADVTAMVNALMVDGEFKTKVLAGIDGAEKIPAELKALDLKGAIGMATIIPEIITIMKA